MRNVYIPKIKIKKPVIKQASLRTGDECHVRFTDWFCTDICQRNVENPLETESGFLVLVALPSEGHCCRSKKSLHDLSGGAKG